jgi:hypothetical protein
MLIEEQVNGAEYAAETKFNIDEMAACIVELCADWRALTAAHARLERERDEARKALCRVYQVMELPDGKHIADHDWELIDALIESGLYDAALTRGPQAQQAQEK